MMRWSGIGIPTYRTAEIANRSFKIAAIQMKDPHLERAGRLVAAMVQVGEQIRGGS